MSARLTIGMPLYNNERTLTRALHSLLNQTLADFSLVLSDDGSSDGTFQLAQTITAGDRRVTIVQQPRNLNYGNFRYLLNRATTPFFMFAAGDDWWAPTFVERCMMSLEHNPSAVLAISQVEFVSGEGIRSLSTGTYALSGSPETNMVMYFASPDDNSRMYGVFRTDVAQRAFPVLNYHAYDWTFSARTLLEGTHVELPEVLMWRDLTPAHQYIKIVRRDTRNPLYRLFPLIPMTSDLKRIPLVKKSRVIRSTLRWMGFRKHVEYMRAYHPVLHRFLRPLYWRILNSLAKRQRSAVA